MMGIFYPVRLSGPLPACLASPLAHSQLLLSRSISCLDFTSLFTTYLPPAALPLIIRSAFPAPLDMRPRLPLCSDAALFASVLV